jgi:hypothetical protein
MVSPAPTQKVQIALLEQEVGHLKKEVAELNASVKELVDAWKAATGMLRLIKVLGMIAGTAGAIVALYHNWRPHG